MPPRKGIVKTGNAGNSSKSSPLPNPIDKPPDGPKPLFPVGFKTPLNLLFERCQKCGWDKPNVETRKNKEGFTAVITLTREVSHEKQSVRMQPHPPLDLPTAQEAKHWGATYALYCFSNHLQLHRLLPPGPREYWAQLAEEHKKAPEHLKWQYEPDPFASAKAVQDRQDAARRKRNVAEREKNMPGTAPPDREYEKAPEVRMAAAIRQQVEDTIKEMASRYPEVGIDQPTVEIDKGHVERSLQVLGFAPHQIRRAIDFLTTQTSEPSPYLASLLALPPVDACISYLLLHTPESDLPPQFLNQQTTSDPFVRATHSGKTSITTRWVAERAIKEAGWPEKPVADALALDKIDGKWDLLTEYLGRKLVGIEGLDFLDITPSSDLTDRDTRRSDEIEAVLAVYTDAKFDETTSTLSIPLPSGPEVMLHVMFPSFHPYPTASDSPRAPPMWVSSTTAPPYVRLHLLASILELCTSDGELEAILQSGEGIIFGAIDCADNQWTIIRDDPPEASAVLRFLLPKIVPSAPVSRGKPGQDRRPKRGRGAVADDRADDAVQRDFELVKKSPAYESMLSTRKKLPAWDAQDEVVRTVQNSRVVVVIGETGCGKTTQLPQFILDACISSSQGSRTNIVITQPRRVSALSVAARVSSERLDDGSVGYAIRGESKQTRRTKLLFCTTGVLLRRMTAANGEGLAGISHVIVDEVHERSVDGDFLLLELRELLKVNLDIKIILMSATINQKVFVDYFDGAPVIEIPGFTHPVKDIYIEDVVPKIKYRPPFAKTSQKQSEEQRREIRESYQAQGLDLDSIRAVENISRSDRVDYQLIAAVVTHIIATSEDPKGAVLIFLPGVQEIRQCMDGLRAATGGQAEIFPLHANLSSDEQRRVFNTTSRRKIVVATNVAETSITIPDVVYVVDSGKVKETQYDTEAGMSRLEETWVTRAAARQRRGRAGRTRPGECYKLYTRKQEENMKRFPVPEILRVPLEALSLQVKVMREDQDVKLFLGKAIDPPKIQAMEKAWSVLEELGAVDWEGKLTALGRHMALLPVDLRLAKMMILGAIFSCLDPVLTIAASLSSKPLFLSPPDKRDEASKARLQFSTANSDLMTDMNAYNQCRQLRTEGKSSHAQRMFYEENFISATTIRDVTSLRQDFLSALSEIGFVSFSAKGDSPDLNVNSGNENLVKAVILGGLWPRVTRIARPNATFDQVAAGTVQRDQVAKEFKIFDRNEGRVFLHPSSVLFGVSAYRSPFLAYFSKNHTSKTFLRDATEVPLYALLLFGGQVEIDHLRGGLNVGHKRWIKMRAWSRIGVLVNQLRLLLDAQLEESIENPQMSNFGQDNMVVQVMLDLITRDGLSAE